MSGPPSVQALALALVVLASAACGDVRIRSLDGGKMLVTTADYRAISQTPAGDSGVHGRITPKYITCAEPSPDVAKAVSTALSISASGGATLPSGVTPEVAAAVSRSRAEALLQMTERLATIQLLRDGLHSACEAYANGAITDTTYSIMLSRFDKMMVTLLVSELAAGAFGRSLGSAGTGADGTASATADLVDKITKTQQAEDAVKTAEEKKNAQDADTAKRELSNSLKAQAASAAKVLAVTGAGGIAPGHSPEVARILAEIQRKYIENLNFDALEVACVSALDRGRADPDVRTTAATYGKKPGEFAAMVGAADKAGLTPFAAYCLSDVLPAIQVKKGELLIAIIQRANRQSDAAEKRAAASSDMKASLKEVEEYVTAAKALLEQMKALKAVDFK